MATYFQILFLVILLVQQFDVTLLPVMHLMQLSVVKAYPSWSQAGDGPKRFSKKKISDKGALGNSELLEHSED